MTRSFIGSLAALLLVASPIHATPITFFGEDDGPGNDSIRLASRPGADAARTDFVNALSSSGTQHFDTFADGTSSVVFAFDSAIVTVGPGGVVRSFPGTDGDGGYAISGDGLWRLDPASLVVTLDKPITAFGFYGVDVGDAGGQLTVSLSNGSVFVVPHTIRQDHDNSGGVLYFGVIDRPFYSITLSNSDTDADRFNFDDFTVGRAAQSDNLAPTPEPGTLLLLGTSLAGMAGAAWRRRAERTAE